MDFHPGDRLRSRLIAHTDAVTNSNTSPIPVYVAAKRSIGLREYARCTFRGFFDPETTRDTPYMWTADVADIECRFQLPTKLRYVWLEIGQTAPTGSLIDLLIDDQIVLSGKRVYKHSTLVARVPETRAYAHLTVTIKASTFVPSELGKGSEDGRALGVALNAIVFGKRRTKYGRRSYRNRTLNQRLAFAVHQWWQRDAA